MHLSQTFCQLILQSLSLFDIPSLRHWKQLSSRQVLEPYFTSIQGPSEMSGWLIGCWVFIYSFIWLVAKLFCWRVHGLAYLGG